VRKIQRKIRKLTNTQIKSSHQAILQRRANRINLHQTIIRKRKIYWQSLTQPYTNLSIVQKIAHKRNQNPTIYQKIKQNKKGKATLNRANPINA
jgi:DNA-binding protein H-NS